MSPAGAECLVPTLVVLVLAVLSKRTIEPLLAGVVVGLAMIDPANLLGAFAQTMLAVMGDETIGWVVMVCGLMGSLIALLARMGGAAAFGQLVARRVRGRTGALMTTWLLGLSIFIDDYLNALAISSSMRKVTDRLRVSREMLAYVVDSTAAPVCVLVPLSTWAVYFAAVVEQQEAVERGQGMLIYIEAIPWMLYPWVALAIVPLVILRVVPVIGPMKGADHRASASAERPLEEQRTVDGDEPGDSGLKSVLLNFVVPMLTLIGFTWYLDVDILKGVLVALAVTLALAAVQRKLPAGAVFDTMLDGFKSMLLPLGTVVAGFMLKEVNDQLQLAPYVIEIVRPVMTPGLLPMTVFLVMSLVAFATASFWGILAVAFPIVLPLATSVGADIPMVVGAMISASACGSHACFYGDSTVLSAHGSGCGAVEHAVTQLPYVIIAASLAALGYLLAGL